MASTAMSVLPFIGYFLLACIVFYLVLRVVRYIKSTRGASTASLPKPVSGNAGKSIFSLGRTTAWGWRKWTAALPRVPWATVNVPVPGRGPTTKNIKNLSVELLPTTGLPPPPSATPTAPNSVMATAPLVDIGDPSTPPLTSTSTFSSFPVTPRTPSPPSHNLLGQLSAQLSVKPMYPTPAHHSYPRPPSPHALLATTPPPKHGPHKRSRSLGGVSVRRLSGGTSGLRNAVRADSDIEVEMKEIRAGIQRGQEHVRGTSREHLLIDFSSSGSSEEEIDDVSPAASDIGVLPLHGRGPPQPHFPYAPSVPPVLPVRVDARTIGRHVPLVDLGEQDTVTQDENSLDDAWRWFGSDQSLASSSSMSSSSSATTMAHTPKNTISSEFSLKSKIQPLVDVDLEDVPVELVSVPQTVHVRHVAADGTHLKDTLHVIESKTMALVDIDDNTSHGEARLVDLGNDEFEEQRVPTLVPVSKSPSPELAQPSTAFEAEAGYSHPLEIEAESVHVQVRPKAVILETPLPADPEASMLFGKAQDPQGLADPATEHLEESQLPEEIATTQVLVDVDVDAGHPSVDSGVSISITPEQDSSSWSWDDVDVEDPWNHHLSMGESTVSDPESDLITFAGGAPSSTSDEEVVRIVQGDHETEELGMLEMSPGGSLLPTAIEDELEREGQDGVPVFDLESADVSFSTEKPPSAEVEFEEEEVTPKPTPVSNAVELPEVVIMDVEEEEFVYEPLVEKTAESPLEDDEVFVYPDPDLPPLPLHLEDAPIVDQPLTTTTTLSVFAEALEAQMNTHLIATGSGSSQAEDVAEKEHLIVPASQRLPSSQTPTPPASPPPTFGSHPPQSHTHTHLRVLNSTTNASSRNRSRTPSPVSPVPRLAVVLPFMEGRGEDKENDTPTALTVGRFSESLLATKPLWSIRASDAPALGIPSSGGVLGASPRMRRSVLGDVDSNVMEEVVAEVEEEVKVEEEETDGDGDDDVLTSEAEVEGNVDAGPVVGIVEQPTPDHPEAPPMKLSTSLPGSFPDVEPTPEVVEPASSVTPTAATSTTATAPIRRPAPTANGTAATQFVIPSARTLVRSPLDIALAMQMRPGLGAGADPAWMVRFLMAVFGWMAVAVAGGDF
ncbi:hypothetical protein M413DRAFT_238544 [Hebeloma cylindrosporum]|uniref:Uncharacterized protein n=1 Tax=Hebeloma cylindrosporum TaxID=76867 RepID=A0A0C3C5H4_HEBCY|nr:hypothetical protein M413DRAFT_238544 [Hebeloma cylindrosporum h7]